MILYTGTLACFGFVIFSSAKRVICVVVACAYPMVNGSILYVLSRRGEAGFFLLHPCLGLLLVTPLTVRKFVAPPRTSFPMVKFHFGIMLGTPTFLLCGLLGL